MSTFLELRDHAAARFNDTTKVRITDTMWKRFVNAALFEFLQAARWPARLTTTNHTLTAGTHNITLTVAELEHLVDVYDTTQQRALIPTPPDLDIRDRLFLESQNSQPIYYHLVGLDVFIFPAPETALGDHTIRVSHYSADPGPLVADGDIPVIPVRYHEALSSGALAQAYVDDQNMEAAAATRKEFEAIIAQAMRELEEEGVRSERREERRAALGGRQ